MASMKKTFFFQFLRSKAEEEAEPIVPPHRIRRELIEIRDLYPPPIIDPRDPWKIRKLLTESDIRNGALVLGTNDVFEYLFRYWTLDMANKAVQGNKIFIILWDLTEPNNPVKHQSDSAFLKKGVNENYVLGWMDVVQNRSPNPGDAILIYWDSGTATLHLKIVP